MDNTDKKTDKETVAVLPEETVSGKKKYTRKFTWTPARKAAFEKCIAARKTGAKLNLNLNLNQSQKQNLNQRLKNHNLKDRKRLSTNHPHLRMS